LHYNQTAVGPGKILENPRILRSGEIRNLRIFGELGPGQVSLK